MWTGPLIQVSNNPYVLDPAPDLSQRRSIDSGLLGVFAVTGSSGAEAAAITALSAIGQRRRSPNWHEFTVASFEVRSRSGKAFAGVDGEALELETPLRFEAHHGDSVSWCPQAIWLSPSNDGCVRPVSGTWSA